MKLKTHTAYNEGQINKDTGNWAVRIYNVHGQVLDTQSGKAKGETPKEREAAARSAINAFVNSIEPKYRREE